VYRIERQIIVHSTEEGGLAEQNGIAKGDVILQMNGMPTSEMSLEKIGELKREPGTQLTLLIQRDGVTREVTLQLKALPDPVPGDDESRDFKRIPD
jgi:C-terminal processing protease CtpA/Prc